MIRQQQYRRAFNPLLLFGEHKGVSIAKKGYESAGSHWLSADRHALGLSALETQGWKRATHKRHSKKSKAFMQSAALASSPATSLSAFRPHRSDGEALPPLL